MDHLVHYTHSVETVASILEFGFLLIPNRRNVIEQFLPRDLFHDQEPQQFGMACFTQVPLELAAGHRHQFGAFGIAVTNDWAIRNRAQRVIYISDSGPVADTFSWLFQYASREVAGEIARYPDDHCRRMSYTSGNMAAALACPLYSALLRIYDYMQIEDDSAQVEWRIVQELPLYFHASLSDRKALIQEALATARTWGRTSVRVLHDDVAALVCPAPAVKDLCATLPVEFSNVTIIET